MNTNKEEINKSDKTYFNIPEYEIVCQECSRLFTSSDENNKVCYECWQKLIDFTGEGQG